MQVSIDLMREIKLYEYQKNGVFEEAVQKAVKRCKEDFISHFSRLSSLEHYRVESSNNSFSLVKPRDDDAPKIRMTFVIPDKPLPYNLMEIRLETEGILSQEDKTFVVTYVFSDFYKDERNRLPEEVLYNFLDEEGNILGDFPSILRHFFYYR